MSDEIKLGSLEFKAEEWKPIIKLNGFCSEAVIQDYSQSLADVANRILREKIAQSDIIYHRCRGTYSCIHEKGLWSSGRSGGTIKSHRARIILIEELPK